MHSTKIRERGYNQALVIAEAIEEKTGASVFSNVLYKTNHTGSQTRLSKGQREENMSGVFKNHSIELINDRNVVIVDDVYTTGATTMACVRELQKGAPKSIQVFTIIRATNQDQSDFALELKMQNTQL
jgi:predicted amidophosphoribosyltransferase